MKNKIIILSGMSCSGKDTALEYIKNKYGYNAIVSTTTRPIRPLEQNGVHYHFKTTEEFKQLIDNDELVEWRTYFTTVGGVPATWHYGVEKKNVPAEKVVVVLDSTGYYSFVKAFGKDNIRLIWVEADKELRRQRNKLRQDYDECEFERREIKDREVFGDLPDHADYTLVNSGDYEEFEKSIDNIIDSIN